MELPRLQPLFEKFDAEGFEVIAVERKRDTELAKRFIAEHGLSYTLLENGEGDREVVRAVYGVRSFPTSFLVGRDGRIMYFHEGFEAGDERELEEQIRSLL